MRNSHAAPLPLLLGTTGAGAQRDEQRIRAVQACVEYETSRAPQQSIFYAKRVADLMSAFAAKCPKAA